MLIKGHTNIAFYGYGQSRKPIDRLQPGTRTWLDELSKQLQKKSMHNNDIYHVYDANQATTQHQNNSKYLVCRHPPAKIITQIEPEIIFNIGAGFDNLTKMKHTGECALLKTIPIVKLDNQDMIHKMTCYILNSVQKDAANIGILGCGHLGSNIAIALSNHGHHVSTWSKSKKNIPGVASYSHFQLNEFFKQNKIVINLLPLTSETKHIINKQTLHLMPYGSYIINVGRGEHVHQEDLLECIDSGHIAGAKLDVLMNEPVPDDHPLKQHPNIMITDHTAAPIGLQESMECIANKIIQIEENRIPHHDISGYIHPSMH